MSSPDQTSKINDPSNSTNIQRYNSADDRRRVAPRTDKDFEKILTEHDKEEEKFSDEGKKTDKKGTKGTLFSAISGKQQAPVQEERPSLFDLSRGSKEDSKEDSGDFFSSGKVESPSDLFTKASRKEKPVEKVESKADSAVNLAGTPKSEVQAPVATSEPIRVSQQERIEQINTLVKAMTTEIQAMKQGDRTDTVITLNHPPIFSGANLVLTSYDSAKGELNIAFEGLTQQAKAILDMPTHRDALIQSLDSKGITVQMFTTTTIVEHPNTENASMFARDQERGQGEEQGRQQREKEDEQA